MQNISTVCESHIFKYGFIVLCTIVLSAFFIQPAMAATKTWDGGGGGDTNMSTAANWDLNTLPAAGDTLTFDGTSGNNATWDSSFVGAQNFIVDLATGYSGIVTISSSTLTIASSTVVAGTLNIGSNTLTIDQDLAIDGGTVTSTDEGGVLNVDEDVSFTSGTFHPAATTQVKGHWTYVGGSYTSGETHAWAVTFASSTASQTFTTGGSGLNYGDITINNTAGGSSDSVVVSGALVMQGALTITAGDFDLATNNASLDVQETNTDGTVTLADDANATWQRGSGAITVSGNILVNDAATMTSGSGLLTLDGTAGSATIDFDDQAISGGLTLNNTHGTGNITLTGTLDVNGALTITQGDLLMNTNNAILDLEGAITVDDNANASWVWGSGAQNLGGNLTQNGSGTITPGGGILTFDGGAAQTVSSSAAFEDITINMSSGNLIVALDTGVTNFNVDGNVTSTAGLLDLSTNNESMDLEGDFEVNGTGGGLQWGTGNLNIGRNFRHSSAGTVTHGLGTLIFDASGNATSTITVDAGTLDLGQTQATGNILLAASEAVTMSINKNFELGASSTLTIDGIGASLVLNGILLSANSATVTFTGGGEDATTLPSDVIYGIVVLNGGVNQTYNAGNNSTFEGTLTVTNGELSLGTAVITPSAADALDVAGQITEGSSGYIVSTSTAIAFVDSAGTALSTLSYIHGDVMNFRVTDEDENINGAAADTLLVTITNQLGDREIITLTETGAATEVFEGGILLRNVAGVAKNNGSLEVNGNITATIAYGDAEDDDDSGSGVILLKGPGVGSPPAFPKEPTVSINDGALTTFTRDVELAITSDGTAVMMLVSSDPTFKNVAWEPFSTTRDFVLENHGFGVKTVYVKVENNSGNQSTLASTSIEYLAPEPEVVEPPFDPEPNPPLESGPSGPVVEDIAELSRADLIRSKANSAVYYFGSDGKRHAFPHERIFLTWFDDFSGVRVVTDELIASIPLGKNMTVRPGTKLIKLQTDPKVYIVGTGAKLHWVKTSELVEGLYGENWEDRLIDVSDALFVDYKRSTDIGDLLYPDGSIIERDEDTFFVQDGMWRKFVLSGLVDNAVPTSYTSTPPANIVYSYGEDIDSREELVKFPTDFE